MRHRLALAAAVATTLSLPQLHPLFIEASWIVVPVATVVVVAALRILIQLRGWGAGWVLAAQGVGLLVGLTALLRVESAVLGVIPTPSSVRDLGLLVARGAVEIQNSPAPISNSAAVGALLALAIGLVAVIVDHVTATFRAPALAGLPLLGIMLVPLFVHYEGTSWVAFSLAAIGFVGLLAVDGWDRTRAWGSHADRPAGVAGRGIGGGTHESGLALRTGAVALAAALVVPVVVPHLAGDTLYTWAGDRRADGESVTTVHPLVSLQRDLRSSPEEVVLTYQTDASQPDYLRTHALDTFDGESWTMSPLNAGRQHRIDDDPLPSPPGRGSEEMVESTIDLAEYLHPMDFLALPYPAQEISAPGVWYADPETLMVFTVSDPAAGGSSYTVRTEVPEVDAEALARSRGNSPSVDDRYLELPDSVSAEVVDLTERVTEGSDSPHESAVALQDWFTGGRFDYDLEPPPVPEGVDPLDDFLLGQRSGYCEQFAGAMAVMARITGIPSRVAVGFTPGERDGDSWVVRRKNAHAWPELYFEGHGWLRFEPTPASPDAQGSAQVPEWAQPAPDQDREETTASTEDGDTQPGTPDGADEEGDAQGEPIDPQLGVDGSGSATGAPVRASQVALALGIALAVLALPWLARGVVRGWRLGRAGDDSAAARAAWAEIRDMCRDLSVPWDVTRSPRAAARALTEAVDLPRSAHDALWRIAHAEEQGRYAPRPPIAPSLRSDLRIVRAGLNRSVGRVARVRGTVLPRSLWQNTADRLRSRAPAHTARESTADSQ